MTPSPVAIATARRNVAQRIERFLNGLDRAGRPPNRRELYYLRKALQKLGAGLFPEGEDAMLKAERIEAIPDTAATAIMTNDAATTDELRTELSGILQNAMPA
jgi:hypothetical protein